MDLLLKEEMMIDHFDVQEICGPQGSMWHAQVIVGDVEDVEEAVDTVGMYMGRIHCKNMADKVGEGGSLLGLHLYLLLAFLWVFL